ncbi:XK-related protein [Camponotus japonicus]
MAQCHQLQHQHEFLPLCDVLFNIISLASYFCDVVFDFAMVYALAHQAIAPPVLFPLSITFIATSLLVSQIVSLRWYLWGARGKLINNNASNDYHANSINKIGNWTIGCVLLLHSTQIGVLWRYFKLFIPVNLTYVKHEVRELCVLRLIHAFCEAAPMLLLQLYVLFGATDDGEIEVGKPKESESKDDSKLAKLTLVSAGLSLWSVCWAVASFSKGAARLRNLERLVLTWLGVLAQLFWRLGTVSARVGVLVAYASLYGGQWLLIVMALHWLTMLTWLLLTPDGLFHGGERLPLLRKTFLASLLAFVYIFAYVNLHETNHRQKMAIFYIVMFLENSLLIGVWMVGVNRADLLTHQHRLQPVTLVLILLALFSGGMFFMGLYYRFFHVRRLRYESGGRMTGSNLTTLSNQDNVEEKQIDYNEEKKVNISISMRKVKLSNGGIPGVFNCRFANSTAVNPNRKKKKPTTFVPPPPPQSQTSTVMNSMTTVADSKQWLNVGNGSRQLIPFWKKPISSNVIQNDGSNERKDETDMALGGSLNVTLIREKLKEKKQQQLRELRAIQEEIKEGKLFPPPSASTSSFSSSPSASNQQPPPNTKLHTSPSSPLFTSPPSFSEQNGTLSSWPPVKMHCLLPPPPSSSYYPNPHSSNSWRAVPQRERADTPEILLAPRCLPHHYSHWSPSAHLSHRLHANQNGAEESSKCEGEGEAEVSDMEGSQISLPRSYTLPREFKYNHPNSVARERERRSGNNKLPSSRFYLPSTNSSDGDVDSADNEDETDSEAQIQTKANHGRNHNKALQKCHVYENNENNDVANPSLECNVSNIMSNNCYSNNSHSVFRPSQLLRTRVKHETKL